MAGQTKSGKEIKNMASLKKRNGKYCVIYRYRDKEGKKKQKWETFDSRGEAVKRMKEIEYKKSNGTFVSLNAS